MKKSYEKPRQRTKSRDITLLRKISLVKAMVFPVVVHRCEIWSIKCKIWSIKLLCWQRSIQSKLWFFRHHVWILELGHKESWVPKNWCFWTFSIVFVVLEKTLESPLDCKENKPVNPKGNQPSIFIGRPDAEVEAPILWPPDSKNWLTGNDPDAGKIWREKEKRTT